MSTTTAPPSAVSPAFPIAARFECDGVVVPVVFLSDRAILTLDGSERALPQTISASGARYSDGAVTFWNKGSEATLEIDERTRMCRVLREP